jgi:hypothetical protein
MKASIHLIILTLLCLGNTLNAQSNWELGMRFGEKSGLDATIPLSKAPRLHPSLNLFEKYVSGALYFDWLFALENGPEGLKFYPGLGPEIYLGPDFEMGVAGNFGAEYSFDFPLTVGLDWRPGFLVTEKLKWYSSNWGIMARFRFGEGVKFVKAN